MRCWRIRIGNDTPDYPNDRDKERAGLRSCRVRLNHANFRHMAQDARCVGFCDGVAVFWAVET